MNLIEGKAAADARAVRDSATYKYAERLYGNFIRYTRGDAPIGLILGHVLRVNPSLIAKPPVARDGRRGFMYASPVECKKLEIAVDKLDDAFVCAYVYGTEINSTSISFYTTYRRLFTLPNANFWKCAYLRNTLGASTFNHIWNGANPHIERTNEPVLVDGNWTIENKLVADATDGAYDMLTSYVGRMTKAPPGWTLGNFQRLVLYECEYTYALWRRYGKGYSKNYGSKPALDDRQKMDLTSRTV